MADVVTTQVLANGNWNLWVQVTDLSDGTGLTNSKIIDAQSTAYAVDTFQKVVPGVHLGIRAIQYNVTGMTVRLLWDATVPVPFATLSGFDRLKYRRIMGLPNPAPAGATGSILVTTIGAAANSAFTLVFEMIKGVPQT